MESDGIVGDERKFARPRLARNQYIVRADRRPLPREVRSNLSGLPGVVLVELKHRKLKRVHAGHVQLRSDSDPTRYYTGLLQIWRRGSHPITHVT